MWGCDNVILKLIWARSVLVVFVLVWKDTGAADTPHRREPLRETRLFSVFFDKCQQKALCAVNTERLVFVKLVRFRQDNINSTFYLNAGWLWGRNHTSALLFVGFGNKGTEEQMKPLNLTSE